LRLYFVSSPLDNLGGCTKNVKVSRRLLHPQQAAKDPHLALAVGCAPASFSVSVGYMPYRKKSNKESSIHALKTEAGYITSMIAAFLT
jgi:hypothetical protein